MAALVGATPAEAPALFAERSAVNWPDDHCSLLLLHGEADREVSRSRRACWPRLCAKGAPVEAIFYPGGDHALTAQHGGVPEALAWFAQYLGGDGADRSFAAHEPDIAAVSTWFLARGSEGLRLPKFPKLRKSESQGKPSVARLGVRQTRPRRP